MRKILLLWCFFPSVILSQDFRYTTQDAELRIEPDPFSAEIVLIAAGTTLIVIDQISYRSGYVKVQFDKYIGYMNSLYLSDEPISSKSMHDSNKPKIGAKTVIKLKKHSSGVFEVSTKLNRVLTIDMILDTGASETSLTPDVVLTLIRTNTISEKDWLEGKYYQFADGTTAKSDRFILREVLIGDIIIENVEASIATSIEAPLLLGQNIFKKLKRIEIDYVSNILLVGD